MWLSHKSATTAVCCRILQPARRCERVANVDSVHNRGGRRQVCELVGDFSNALDLCDSLIVDGFSTRLGARLEAPPPSS
jgi:hypothetical protein